MVVPITITNSSPVTITTASPSLSYEQILYTLNQTAYQVNGLDIQANAISQLSEPINYTKRNADGTISSKGLSPVVDPNLYLASINGISMNLLLDALSTYSFNLEPNESITLIFYVDPVTVWDVSKALNSEDAQQETEVKNTAPIKNGNDIVGVLFLTAASASLVYLIIKLKQSSGR